MIHLREIQVRSSDHLSDTTFPFNLPIIQSLTSLTLESSVTFLVGENGSGKSTLLEAIACAVGSITVGAESVERDDSLEAMRQLATLFKLIWNKRTRKGFFMRSEDFFGFVKQQAKIRADMLAELRRVDEEYAERSELAKGLAKMAFAGELHAMKQQYGENLDGYSHGESYFTLFKSRFIRGGLYLLDEPEAPLSPMRQLAFLAMLDDMVKQDAQFIIATHSPIIMAYPNATILQFTDGEVEQVAYDDLEHVTITRSFLNDPQAYLRHLMGE
ncbi:MAG: AAA family ATPase [Aggregatilineales bacterium]